VLKRVKSCLQVFSVRFSRFGTTSVYVSLSLFASANFLALSGFLVTSFGVVGSTFRFAFTAAGTSLAASLGTRTSAAAFLGTGTSLAAFTTSR
jgi:hypothetical protein